MQDDFASLFAFNRWANSKMLDACRKLTPEQYAAEPAPGWSAVRSTVYHLAVVTDVWLRTLAGDPDTSFPTEAEVPGVDDAERILERAYRILDSFLPKLGREELATPRPFQPPRVDRGGPAVGGVTARGQSHDVSQRTDRLQAQALRRPATGDRLGVLGHGANTWLIGPCERPCMTVAG